MSTKGGGIMEKLLMKIWNDEEGWELKIYE